MTRFQICLNKICIEDLGFDEALFSGIPCLCVSISAAGAPTLGSVISATATATSCRSLFPCGGTW